jgi:hypothetical protein
MGMKWQELPAKSTLLDSNAYPAFPAVSRRDVRPVCAKQPAWFPRGRERCRPSEQQTPWVR